MSLDLSSLQKAVAALEKALRVSNGEMNKDQQDVIKAGVIQSFEFTYELCWKFMKQWLENNIGSVHVDGVTRRELFRMSAENGLIDEELRIYADVDYSIR